MYEMLAGALEFESAGLIVLMRGFSVDPFKFDQLRLLCVFWGHLLDELLAKISSRSQSAVHGATLHPMKGVEID